MGLLFGAVPLAAVLGMLGYFGFATLNWNGEPLTGTSALVGGPFMGLFFALTGTAFAGSAAALGLWIYSKFARLRIEYDEPTAKAEA